MQSLQIRGKGSKIKLFAIYFSATLVSFVQPIYQRIIYHPEQFGSDIEEEFISCPIAKSGVV